MTATLERIHGTSAPTHAVILLHGLGASADDFVPVIPYLGLASAPSIRFVFPQAPNRPITVNNGYVMPGWYDIKGVDLADKEDLPGIRESQATLEGLIADQVAEGIPSENIIVAGFSQGGAVAYYTGIRCGEKLGGILALSTYLPFMRNAASEHSGANIATPILAMHGKQDPVVPLAAGRLSADSLAQLGYPVQWKEYNMEHSVIPEQLVEVGAWINRIFQGR